MVKNITKVDNSQGLIFDAALRELTGLKAGDQVNVTVHAGGTIIITLITPTITEDEARDGAKELIKQNPELFKCLA
jgi:antitoxin component of MazEF toxin-antitoxin module